MLATEAEPAWTAEEIAGTFHVSEENITQLQEDDNGHTLFVLDEYTFVCAPNGARAAAVTYTADYPKSGYYSKNLNETGWECHGFALFIFKMSHNGVIKMRRIYVFTAALLIVFLLSACSSGQLATTEEPQTPAVIDPIQESEEPVQSEPEEPAEPESIVVQTDLSMLPELDLIEPETRTAEEYFTQVAVEKRLSLDRKNFHLGLGSTLNELPYSNMPACDNDALYLYTATSTHKGKLQGVWKLADNVEKRLGLYGHAEAEFGRTNSSVFYISADGKSLMRVNLREKTSEQVFQTEHSLLSISCGANIVFFLEKLAEDNYTLYRLYEPEMKLEAVVPDIPAFPAKFSRNGRTTHEIYIGWKTPAMAQLREEHKEDYWTELWTSFSEEARASWIVSYRAKHPDYVDDGGVPPYDETCLPGASTDVVEQWVWEHYGVPDRAEYYCDTLTGYHKLMYSFYGSQYYFPDGTPWNPPEEAYDNDDEPFGLEFWRFLPSD